MFEELTLDRQLRLGIDALQHTEATDVQRRVVPAALAGGDLLVSARTGSGKTLAYLIPLAEKILSSRSRDLTGTLGLVLVPTRELARQVEKDCGKLFSCSPLDVRAITGGVEFKYQKALLRKDPEVVVATPGRLLEHLEAGNADLGALQTVVLDEADRMLELGLREAVLAIADRCPPRVQVLMVSATLGHPGLVALADTLLDSPQTIALDPARQAHSAITHQLILADGRAHKDKLLAALLSEGELRRALVFCNRRKTAERLASLLAGLRLRCACLHGELSTEVRKQVMQQFHEDKVNVLCATDVAARGLDIEGIEAVINYDLPQSGDDYIHRTGRTGRAGAPGLAISLVEPAQWQRAAGIEHYLGLAWQRRSLPGLKARFRGPADTAAGVGPGERDGRKPPRKKPASPRKRERAGRDTGAGADANDGSSPLKKKKPG